MSQKKVKTQLLCPAQIQTQIQIQAGILGRTYFHELLRSVKEEFEGKNSRYGFLGSITGVTPLSNPVVNPYEFTHALLHLEIEMDVLECQIASGDKIYGIVTEYIPNAQVAKITNGHLVMISLIEDEYSNIQKGDVCVVELGDVRQYTGQKETMYMSEITDVFKKGSIEFEKCIGFVNQ